MSFLSSEQKNHLKFLTDQPKELLPEFCKMAMELITEGGNEKKYEIAASKYLFKVLDSPNYHCRYCRKTKH